MKLFGLKKVKPPTVTRFGGLRILQVGRRGIATTRQNIVYLRHASALSAAVAKNITSTLNQPDEVTQESDSNSKESFLEAHSRYSFITVLTLMSLFMVVTLSATGFMLAFYRKKNAVFVANPKSDADSQFELDDIDSGDVETCRRDKGECYVHLSEDSDEDEVVHDCSGSREFSEETAGRRTKRSMTFPELHEVLKKRKSVKTYDGSRDWTDKDRPVTNALTPLMTFSKNTCTKSSRPYQHQSNNSQEGNKRSYQNFNPQHHPHRHNHTRGNKSHTKSSSTAGFHYESNHRHHLAFNGLGKLRRSYTIHAIPQTDPRPQSRSSALAGYNRSTREHNKAPQARHRKMRDSAGVSSPATDEASCRLSHQVAVDMNHQTTSFDNLQHNRNGHRADKACTKNLKRNQEAHDTPKAGLSNVATTSHHVTVDANHQTTFSSRLHDDYSQEGSHTKNPNSSHKLNSTNQANSSSVVRTSHQDRDHKTEVNGALMELEDQTLANSPSLPGTVTAAHPSSTRDTLFCTQMLTISNAHRTIPSSKESTAAISTVAANAKFINAHSLLGDSQPIPATEANAGLLNPSDHQTISLQSKSRPVRLASTSHHATRLPPPPKSSSKRKQKQTKERDKK